MTEWTLEHPILTFLLILALIFTIDNAHVNWAKVKLAKIQKEQENKTQ